MSRDLSCGIMSSLFKDNNGEHFHFVFLLFCVCAKILYKQKCRDNLEIVISICFNKIRIAVFRCAVTARNLCSKRTVATEFQLITLVARNVPREIVVVDTNAIPFVAQSKFMTAKCPAMDIWIVETMCKFKKGYVRLNRPKTHKIFIILERCPMNCHIGKCLPCMEVIEEAVECTCGQTVLHPPVPCNKIPPKCPFPCDREHECQHVAMHTCHYNDICPPCMELVETWCFGLHEV